MSTEDRRLKKREKAQKMEAALVGKTVADAVIAMDSYADFDSLWLRFTDGTVLAVTGLTGNCTCGVVQTRYR